MKFHSRTDLHVEVLDRSALVWVPGHDQVVCLEGAELAAFELARDGVDAVPEALVVPTAGLVELGIVETGAWDRRRVLQLGGITAAAAVAIVALPTPAAAQSEPGGPGTTTPTVPVTLPTTTLPPEPLACPLGVVAALEGPAAAATVINVNGNQAGNVTINAPFAIDTTALDPAVYGSSYTILGTSARLTRSGGAFYNTSGGLGTKTGTVGSIDTSPGIPNWNGVQFSNGTYTAAGPNPVRLLAVSISYTLTFTSPSAEVISCDYTLTWDITTQPTGVIVFGVGTLNYSPTVTPA